MNVLLVDDDYFVVTALQKKIAWKSLYIENVYTANNVAQAKDILKKFPVQIMICDIEMPQGSGLDLLAWIREEQYSVQAIFLTNYADFNYAQKAIELQSFEYFLKPIEFDKLTLIIKKAISKANEQSSKEKVILDEYFWNKNQNKIKEYFWRNQIMKKTSLSKSDEMIRLISENNLSYQMTEIFLPLLFNLFPNHGSLGKEDKSLFDFAFQNMLNELFKNPLFSIDMIMEYKDFTWIVVVKWNDSPDSHLIEFICSSFIQKANEFLKCDVCCNIAISGKLEEIQPVFRQLIKMNEEMIRCRNKTFLLENYNKDENKETYIPPNLLFLDELLNQNNPAAFVEEASQYLKKLLNKSILNVSVLSLFRLDIIQLVFSFLKRKEIQAHKLYTGRTYDFLFINSLNSIEDMEKYVSYLVHTATQYQEFTAQPKSVVEEIKQYIHFHCDQELTRTSLAEIVYLNPDYLARLFKKETGISLGNYIIQVRIMVAKKLLETTNSSMENIASRVGYKNYSHFSKLFKQEIGLTPNEYKKNQIDPKITGRIEF